MREQFWMLPSGEDGRYLRATVFRPADAGAAERHPVVVINHGTAESTRMAVSMPIYYWLSRWFVDRGYIVVLPQRRGHGATGGTLSEAIGNCANPDHFQSGQVAADDIAAVVDYFRGQPFVDSSDIVVAGISTGGWASLAYASRNPDGVRAVINFSGGRGGHAGGMANAVCGERQLIESARRFGEAAKVPTLWFYSDNDSYFGPELARSMAKAWTAGGGQAELHVLGAYGAEGHNIADDRAGWDLWGGNLAGFLDSHVPHEAAAPQVAQAPADVVPVRQAETARASNAAFQPARESSALVAGN
jgi:dienelactone hydrolase